MGADKHNHWHVTLIKLTCGSGKVTLNPALPGAITLGERASRSVIANTKTVSVAPAPSPYPFGNSAGPRTRTDYKPNGGGEVGLGRSPLHGHLRGSNTSHRLARRPCASKVNCPLDESVRASRRREFVVFDRDGISDGRNIMFLDAITRIGGWLRERLARQSTLFTVTRRSKPTPNVRTLLRHLQAYVCIQAPKTSLYGG